MIDGLILVVGLFGLLNVWAAIWGIEKVDKR
jgi:hypothetical protein